MPLSHLLHLLLLLLLLRLHLHLHRPQRLQHLRRSLRQSGQELVQAQHPHPGPRRPLLLPLLLPLPPPQHLPQHLPRLQPLWWAQAAAARPSSTWM